LFYWKPSVRTGLDMKVRDSSVFFVEEE